MKKEQRRWRGK